MGGSDAIGLKKHHDIAYGALLIPCSLNRFCPLLTDTRDLVEATRILVDDFESIGSEMTNDFFGVRFSDAVDEAATKVFADTVDGGGERDLNWATLNRSPLRLCPFAV